MAEEDFEHFKNSFNSDSIKDYKKDVLVKNGGLQAMLGCYLKHNKTILKKFKGEKSKKRSRANSNVSVASSTKKREKKVKDKKKKKGEESVAKNTRSRT